MRTITTAVAAVLLVALAGPAEGKKGEAFSGDIEKLTEDNTDYRRVLFTAGGMQVVAMSIPKDESIGLEVHGDVDQCFFVVDGVARAIVEGREQRVREDGVLCVPAGTRHDVQNAGEEPLKLFTTYAPPEHPPGTVQHTKADALAAEKAEKQAP